MKRICLFLFLVLLNVSGCAPPLEKRPPLYTVTDDTGRTVSLYEKPVRIVSVSYGIDEILLEMTDSSRIRALSRYAGDGDITFVTKEERDLIGHTAEPNAESILAERPDLVFLNAGTGREVIDTLTDMGIPVYVSLYPKAWPDLEKKILGIGRAIGEESSAQTMVTQMNGRRQAIEERLSGLPPGKERSVLALSFSGIVGKKGNLFADLLRISRIDNKALLLPSSSEAAVFTKESVIEYDPDILLLPTWNFDGRSQASALKEEILHDPAYRTVRAVQAGQLFYVPDKYRYVSSQHAADTVEILARTVYPEYFTDLPPIGAE